MKALAENVMIKEVISVKENYSLFQLEELFFNENISGAPVIDDEGHLIGIVSKTDVICNELEHELQTIMSSFASLFSEEMSEFSKFKSTTLHPSSAQVKDIMTKSVLTIEKDTPIEQIASIMLKEKIHRLVVIDQGKVIGLISSMDLLPLISGGKFRYGG